MSVEKTKGAIKEGMPGRTFNWDRLKKNIWRVVRYCWAGIPAIVVLSIFFLVYFDGKSAYYDFISDNLLYILCFWILMFVLMLIGPDLPKRVYNKKDKIDTHIDYAHIALIVPLTIAIPALALTTIVLFKKSDQFYRLNSIKHEIELPEVNNNGNNKSAYIFVLDISRSFRFYPGTSNMTPVYQACTEIMDEMRNINFSSCNTDTLLHSGDARDRFFICDKPYCLLSDHSNAGEPERYGVSPITISDIDMKTNECVNLYCDRITENSYDQVTNIRESIDHILKYINEIRNDCRYKNIIILSDFIHEPYSPLKRDATSYDNEINKIKELINKIKEEKITLTAVYSKKIRNEEDDPDNYKISFVKYLHDIMDDNFREIDPDDFINNGSTSTKFLRAWIMASNLYPDNIIDSTLAINHSTIDNKISRSTISFKNINLLNEYAYILLSDKSNNKFSLPPIAIHLGTSKGITITPNEIRKVKLMDLVDKSFNKIPICLKSRSNSLDMHGAYYELIVMFIDKGLKYIIPLAIYSYIPNKVIYLPMILLAGLVIASFIVAYIIGHRWELNAAEKKFFNDKIDDILIKFDNIVTKKIR